MAGGADHFPRRIHPDTLAHAGLDSLDATGLGVDGAHLLDHDGTASRQSRYGLDDGYFSGCAKRHASRRTRACDDDGSLCRGPNAQPHADVFALAARSLCHVYRLYLSICPLLCAGFSGAATFQLAVLVAARDQPAPLAMVVWYHQKLQTAFSGRLTINAGGLMAEEILVNVTPREVRVALFEDAILQEIHIERSLHQGLAGNIYKGKINRLLPGIQAAFVDMGLERSGFLHISDLREYETLLNQTGNALPDIRTLLHVGQELLVQVYKDPLGTKGARLTTFYTIPSRYLVLTPGIPQIAVSQKIIDEAERERLTRLITPSDEGGYIFRTVAEGVTETELAIDKEFLNTLWREVSTRARHAKAGEIVYADIPIVLRVLRDLAGYAIEKIRVDHPGVMKEMQAFAKQYVPELSEKIEYYADDRPILDIYSAEDELQKALQRKVYLKSGGHLVFDQTEAMTTIDVNTGSYVGHGSLEQTIFKTNLEAVDAIARQVRLRNLGGIIIIDFIDMMDPIHKTHLIESLKTALAKDSVRTEVSELTSLGLVQMTRKRTRESLEHILCVPCPLCQHRGSIKSFATVCYEIFRELKRIAGNYPWAAFLVIASDETVNFLLDEESTLLADLEAQLGKPIKLRVEPSYKQEQFDILPLSE